MTKAKYQKILIGLLAGAALLALGFLIWMIVQYESSNVLEPFFIGFLVLAYQAAARLIVGVAPEVTKEGSRSATDKGYFALRNADLTFFRLFQSEKAKKVLISDKDEANVAQHTCAAEILHDVNMVLTVLALLFALFADGRGKALLVIALLVMVALVYESVLLFANRYARFEALGTLPSAEEQQAQKTAKAKARQEKKEKAAEEKAKAAALKKEAKEKAAAKKAAAEKAEAERQAAEKAAAEKAEAERQAAEKAAAEKAEAERQAAEKAAAEKAEAERQAAEKAAAKAAALAEAKAAKEAAAAAKKAAREEALAKKAAEKETALAAKEEAKKAALAQKQAAKEEALAKKQAAIEAKQKEKEAARAAAEKKAAEQAAARKAAAEKKAAEKAAARKESLRGMGLSATAAAIIVEEENASQEKTATETAAGKSSSKTTKKAKAKKKENLLATRSNEDLSFSGLAASLGWEESPEDFEATASQKDDFYTAVDSSGLGFMPKKSIYTKYYEDEGEGL